MSDEVFLSEAETTQGTDKDGKTCKVRLGHVITGSMT